MFNIKQFIYPTKNNILDPLSVIIKLFIFSYTEKDSKISVLNNRLIIQDGSYLQATYRIINGDNKNDINMLLFPIIYACQKYIMNDETKNSFEDIFKRVIISLDKLSETYKGEEITNNINNLKGIISAFLEKDEIRINVILNNNLNVNYDIKKNIYQHLDKIWNIDRLNILFGFINEIISETSKELQIIEINCLNEFMNFMDIVSNNLLKSLNS